MKKPTVSVLTISYNQEKYIEQVLESVRKQKTNFLVEHLIADDCSTDKTRDILQKYKKKYPDNIRLIFNKKNKGAAQNFFDTYLQCRGKYIAFLEGDDYWTSKNKLQAQVDFLDKNKDCSICYHKVKMVNRYGQVLNTLPLQYMRRKRASLVDLLLNQSFMATCSTMVRKLPINSFPSLYKKMRHIADMPLNILHAQNGKIGYLNENMAVYRNASSKNAFTGKRSTAQLEETIRLWQVIDDYLKKEFTVLFQSRIAAAYLSLATYQFFLLQIVKARKSYKEYSKRSAYHNRMNRQISVSEKFIKIVMQIIGE